MKKILFWNLLILVFGISNLACQSANQPANTINSANGPTPITKPPTSSAGGAASENTVVNTTKPANADAEKSGPEDSKDKVENRCGWFSNPTPANAWLDDKDGEWIIGVQGGFQAEGDWPEFPDDRWVKTNVNYGYGCACLRVKVDYKNKRITEIVSGTSKPLADCRRDKALTEPSK
jgi:hypothetical protein